MPNKRKVITKSGKLYQVSEYCGTYNAYRVEVGLLWDNTTHVGKARNLEDALALIKAYANEGIREIGNW